ncbi:MAG: tetratricopeptide repeat protein [Myxococcota bacterium]|nr:tetratricopeptide repeat protein [Myxococcota bacterium]
MTHTEREASSLWGQDPPPAVYLGVCAALVTAIAAVYGQSLGFSFVYLDDAHYVLGNPVVPSGLSVEGIAWAFSESFDGNWFPATWISHMVDVELYGVDPGGHHATNVVLHAINTLLVLVVFHRLSGHFWPSAFVAAIFAVHPMHVESVAWVAERKNVLSTLFGLLAIGAYERFARRPQRRWPWAATALLALSLLSKPMLVTLPFALLLLDYWPLRRWPGEPPGRLLLEKLPLFALSLGACLVTWKVQNASGAMLAGDPLDVLQRLANAVLGYSAYLGRTLWPQDLVALYPHPYLPASGGIPPSGARLLGSALVLVAISAAVWRLRRQRYLPVGWLWFLGTLVPVIGIVQVGEQSFADRYGYVPQLGLSIMAAWGGRALLGRVRRAEFRRALAALAFAVAVPLGIAAHAQAAHWRLPTSPFERALAIDPGNHFMRFGLAAALRRTGQPEAAETHYRLIVEARPDSARAENGIGVALQDQGENAAAIAHFERALAIQPANALVLGNLGRSLRAQGRNAAAREAFLRALELRPDSKRLQRDLASLE